MAAQRYHWESSIGARHHEHPDHWSEEDTAASGPALVHVV